MKGIIERLNPDHDGFGCGECREEWQRIAWLNHDAILAALRAGQALIDDEDAWNAPDDGESVMPDLDEARRKFRAAFGGDS